MSEPRALQFAVRLYLMIAVPFLLVAVGARLLLSDTFLQLEYQRPGFPIDSYGFTTADRLRYGPHALRFLFNGEPIEFLAAHRVPGDKCWNPQAGADDCALFSERELRHMADVKQMVTLMFAAALLSAALAGLMAVVSASNRRLRCEIGQGLRRGCQLTLLLVACLAVVSIGAWDRAFDRFHTLFFAAGTWRFPYSDSLIRLYPEQLFFDAALLIAAFASLCAAALLGWMRLWGRRSRR